MLRVVHAGVYMYGGGAERWLGALAPLLAAESMQIEKSVILGRKHYDRAFARTLPFPVSVVAERGLAREARNADVLMWWGPVPVDRCLARLSPGDRPRATVFVAHSPFARDSLAMGQTSVDHVICVAEHLRDMVEPRIASSILYLVTDRGQLVARRDRASLRHSLGFAPDDFVTGFVGSLDSNKRPDALIDAVATLPARYKALIVGNGELHRAITRKARAIGGGRVKVTSTLQNVGDYYRAFDAICLPSREEGFSLVSMEALQLGIPLLITRHGDVPKFFRHGENAWLLDERRLVDTVREGIEAISGDPSRGAAMAYAGERLARRFSDYREHARAFADTLRSTWERKTLCPAPRSIISSAP